MKTISQVKKEIQAHHSGNKHLVGQSDKFATAARKHAVFLKDALMTLESGCNLSRFVKDRDFCRKKLRELNRLARVVNNDTHTSKEQKKKTLSDLKRDFNPQKLKRQIQICDYILEGVEYESEQIATA